MRFGADPGGKKAFGVAVLEDDGSYRTSIVSSVDEALAWFKGSPRGVGIDAPMWWSSGSGGDRKADQFIRRTYGVRSGTVQAANSLKGAVLIQGIMLALRLRERWPSLPVSETHPKALCKAHGWTAWETVAELFGLEGRPATEHERDALLSAVAIREGIEGRWALNLALERLPGEQDPQTVPHGPLTYYWPEKPAHSSSDKII